MNFFKGLNLALRRLRYKRRLTQLQVATAIGNLRPTIQVWESGKAAPRLENVAAYLEAVGADLSDLFLELDKVQVKAQPHQPLPPPDAEERERRLLALAKLEHLPRNQQRLYLNALEDLRTLVVTVAGSKR